ncbi:alpha/beta fold hydrolase [Burkholderia lata]|uniref:Alpha/beta hydrolase n=1 Tax=Burkholderia lata (strain ATCC 17760 / DSM 23089 / LMG 22485 / NCIMB 9086 / R18194 / 383) TaxID=482957 RepID=A0A6P2H0E2_BURL3|nr:alpha/beta hydrolase [Burkholderia lata]VWB10070.1 alpha/beta hydrolase [Burkholderia lata]VWB18318.1 alpha/beta hydrolase [Burkholderia lata]
MNTSTTTGTRAACLTGTPRTWQTRDGIQLAGSAWGDPDGTPVILLHGSGQTRHAWAGMARSLGAAGFHAIAFDARGHGDSGWSLTANYSQGAMIRDLERVVATLDGRRPILVGAGLGGGTALLAVGEGYLDAQALVLVNITPHIEPDGASRLHSFMRQPAEGFGSPDEAADAIRRYRSLPAHALSQESVTRSLRYDDGKYRWHWDPLFLAWPRDLTRRHARFSASARRLKLPTLLARGEASEIVSEQGAREFLKLCPHAEYADVQDAGHTVAGEHYDLFAHVVLRFLARQAAHDPAMLLMNAAA